MKVGKNVKRIISSVVAVALTLSVAPVAVSAADYDNHWAKAQIKSMIDGGIVSPDKDGNVSPQRNITRAEMTVLVNKAFKLSTKGNATFSDVKSSDWFADSVAVSVGSGVFAGDANGKFRPAAPISRQEVAVVVAKAAALAADDSAAAKFADAATMPSWSKGSIGAVTKAGIMNGYTNGTFKPTANITRAEAFVTINGVVNKGTTPVVTEPVVSGDITVVEANQTLGSDDKAQTVKAVLVKGSGAVLKNINVTGDLTIADTVGNGDVTLSGVTVEGKVYIKGGGANSIHINDTKLMKSKLNNVVVTKSGVSVKLASGTIASISFEAMGKLIASAGAKVESVLVNTTGSVSLQGAIDKVSVEMAKANLTLTDAKVASLVVAKDAAGSKIDVTSDSTVAKATVDAAVSFLGKGTISEAAINVKGVTTEKAPAKSTGSETASVSSSSSSGGGGGSSSGRETPVAVEKITVSSEKAKMDTAIVATAKGANDKTPTSLTYQWYYSTKNLETTAAIGKTPATEWVAITGATNASYTPASPVAASNYLMVVAMAYNNSHAEHKVLVEAATDFALATPTATYDAETNKLAISSTTLKATGFTASLSKIKLGGTVVTGTTEYADGMATITVTNATTIEDLDLFATNGTKTGALALAAGAFVKAEGSLQSRVIAATDVVVTNIAPPVAVAFEDLAANGTEDTVDTTELAITFDEEVDGLTAADFTVTGATKGALDIAEAPVYTLTVSNVTVAQDAEITVKVAKKGFVFTPDTKAVAANVNADNTAVTLVSIEADGTANEVDTTELTITFSDAVDGLDADDFEVTGATKGILEGDGPDYTLAISEITVAEGGKVTVSVSKTDFTFMPGSMDVVVHKAPTEVAFEDLTADGVENTTATTELTMTFDVAVEGLTADDITVTGATKGELTGEGTGYVLAISDITVAEGANVTVALEKVGYVFDPTSKTVAVHKAATAVAFSTLTANGTASSTDTTVLSIAFDKTVAGLTADHFTVTGATKGVLGGTAPNYTLAISNITVAEGETVTVAVAKPGTTFTPASKTVAVHVKSGKTAVAFSNVVANGEANKTTTSSLAITFGSSVTELTADNFTVTGATKGLLTGSGTSYTLAISNITVAQGENVTVAVSHGNYTFTPEGSKTVKVHKAIADITSTPISTKAVGHNTITVTLSNAKFNKIEAGASAGTYFEAVGAAGKLVTLASATVAKVDAGTSKAVITLATPLSADTNADGTAAIKVKGTALATSTGGTATAAASLVFADVVSGTISSLADKDNTITVTLSGAKFETIGAHAVVADLFAASGTQPVDLAGATVAEAADEATEAIITLDSPINATIAGGTPTITVKGAALKSVSGSPATATAVASFVAQPADLSVMGDGDFTVKLVETTGTPVATALELDTETGTLYYYNGTKVASILLDETVDADLIDLLEALGADDATDNIISLGADDLAGEIIGVGVYEGTVDLSEVDLEGIAVIIGTAADTVTMPADAPEFTALFVEEDADFVLDATNVAGVIENPADAGTAVDGKVDITVNPAVEGTAMIGEADGDVFTVTVTSSATAPYTVVYDASGEVTAPLTLESVTYDNNTLLTLDDDTIILDFSDAITDAKGAALYTVVFDSNGAAPDGTKITLAESDFAPSISGGNVVLTLTQAGQDKIDNEVSATGSVTVTIADGSTIEPIVKNGTHATGAVNPLAE